MTTTTTDYTTLPTFVDRLLAERDEINRKLDAIRGVLAGNNGNGQEKSPAVSVVQGAAAVVRAVDAMKKPAGKRRRGRGSFAETGEESILAFVGYKDRTNADLREHWESTGRKGGPDNALGRLVAQKKLRRTKLVGQRGSRYALA